MRGSDRRLVRVDDVFEEWLDRFGVIEVLIDEAYPADRLAGRLQSYLVEAMEG